jgi:hypothetical protein
MMLLPAPALVPDPELVPDPALDVDPPHLSGRLHPAPVAVIAWRRRQEQCSDQREFRLLKVPIQEARCAFNPPNVRLNIWLHSPSRPADASHFDFTRDG